jgi:MFS family permease
MTDHSPQAGSAHEHVRFNTIVNIFDGAFFGSALGFASFITIIPLFVSRLTDSAILIGLVPAIHAVGWQLPQLLTSGRIQGLSRYKPMVLAMTISERVPFFGLALLAWLLPGIGRSTALTIAFVLLIWQGLGGGLTATVWQSMIGKIIPVSWRGGFFGAQSSAANLFASVTAVLAGQILERFTSPLNFTLCFLLAGLSMAISYFFLASTREVEHVPSRANASRQQVWEDVKGILRSDGPFRRFVLIRAIFQLGMMAFSFYAVYAVGELGASEGLVGWLTGILIFADMAANPVLGALGDRRGHRLVLFVGALAGIATVVGWTTTMVISLEFGTPAEQATYIGLSNTIIAPATLAAPFLAGWMVESFGYQTMFRTSAGIFILTALLALNLYRESSAVNNSLTNPG